MSDITMGEAPGGAPGSPDSNESGGTSTATTGATTGSGILMYATMPLQIGRNVQGLQAVPQIVWKQFATSPQLVLCLQDANGVALNLTGAQSVTLRICPIGTGGTVTSETMAVLYANGGLVAYAFQPSDVAIPGNFNIEIEVVMSDGSCMYFPSTGYLGLVINPSLGGP